MNGRQDFSGGVAFVDGEYVALAEARIPMMDRGFIRSDVTYDVFHVRDGVAFRLDDHLDRFKRNADALRLVSPYSREAMGDILLECVRRGGFRDAYVQMMVTRGLPASGGSRDPRMCVNRFYAFAMPYVSIANERQLAEGLHVLVSGRQRIPTSSLDPKIKNFHWLDLTLGLMEAYDAGADTEVLVDADGNLTEGPGFNIFLVKGGALATPAEGVFDGMTRRTVLELCPEIGLKVAERLVPAKEALEADEVFISSTAGGIMPVTKINSRPVGDGAVGPVTKKVFDAYWGRKADGWLGTPVDYPA